MQKMKKLVAFLLVLAMAVSLLPAVVFAEDSGSENRLVLDKQLNVAGDKLTLSAYITGTTVITEQEESVPCDIVLVLDTSYSMEYNVSTGYDYLPHANNSYADVETTQYFYNWNGEYVRVRCAGYNDGLNFYSWLYFDVGNVRYYLKGDTVYQAKENSDPGKNNIPQDVNGNSITAVRNGVLSFRNATVYNGNLYYYSQTNEDRMTALKRSVNSFIDEVAANAAETDVNHRISIVKFAHQYYYDQDTNVNNDAANSEAHRDDLTEGDHHGTSLNANYCEVVKNLTDAQDGTNALHTAVNGLTRGGYTNTDLGMVKAGVVLDKTKNSGVFKDDDPTVERKQVVIMFTDGQPSNNNYNAFNGSIATRAVQASLALKNSGVTVYTVGIYDEEDATTDMVNYMNAVSSNYPNATAYNNRGQGSDQGYFMRAQNAEQLTEIFTTIMHQSIGGGTTSTLSSSTVLKDVVSDYFQIPSGASGNVSAYYVEQTGLDGSGKPVFDENNKYSIDASYINVDRDSGTVSVNGFDYVKHYVTLTPGTNGTNTNNEKGCKLIVEIPIEPGSSSAEIPADCIHGDIATVFTNKDTSGIYDGNIQIAGFDSPKKNIDYFTIQHEGATTYGSNPVFTYHSVSTDAFDFTDAVTYNNELKAYNLYGGLFKESGCEAEDHCDRYKFVPLKGTTYYMWEVSPDHLKPKNLCAYADIPGTDRSEFYVEKVYLVTAVDRYEYENVGFVVSADPTLAEDVDSATKEKFAVDAYDYDVDLTAKKVAYTKIKLTQKGLPEQEYTYYQAYKAIAPYTENSLISCYRLDTINDIPFYEYSFENETPFYFKAFWTTLDGALIFSATTREAWYQSDDGKSLVVDDHEGYRFWAIHQAKVIDKPIQIATHAEPIDVQGTYSYDQEDSADTVMMPMRTLLAAAKPPVEESADEPIDDPVVPVAPEYAEVFDNGECYKAMILNGAVTLEPAGASGKIFVGWFADEACTEAADLTSVEDGETIYAKYISDAYLSVKYTESILAKKFTVVSALDARDYVQTGFILRINGEKTIIPVSTYSNSYMLMSAKGLFGSSIAVNAPIMTCDINFAGIRKNSIIEVEPYVITKDGTTVYGDRRILTFTGFSIKG